MTSDPIHKPPAPDKISRNRRLFFYWLPLVLYCAAIFLQSAFPAVQQASLFPHFDKLLHMGAYGVMAWLFARALTREAPALTPGTIKAAALAFACLYGLSDEIHQAFVPSRTADIWDFAADTAGALAWILVFGPGNRPIPTRR